jgi:predicted P-loop ATPase
MTDTPKPTNVVQLTTPPAKPEANQVIAPVFPHTRPRGNGADRILNTADNLAVLLDHLGLKGVLNEMTFELEVLQDGKPTQSIEAVRSKIISAMSIYDMPLRALDDHLTALSQSNLYHPVRDWLDVGEWDGVNRVGPVINCLNAVNGEIAWMVMSRWLVGCVASLYEPRFKSKLAPILQGDQSFMKTAFIDRLSHVLPRSFLEGAELNPSNKDSVLQAIRSWIVELGELERTTKARFANQGSIKAFLTREVDTVRPAYAVGDIKKPRKTHFIASVNGADFLKDETGNSRYGVIEIARPIDMDKVNEILGWEYDGTGSLSQPHPERLKQFWLEVKAMYLGSYGWMLTVAEQRLVSGVT